MLLRLGYSSIDCTEHFLGRGAPWALHDLAEFVGEVSPKLTKPLADLVSYLASSGRLILFIPAPKSYVSTKCHTEEGWNSSTAASNEQVPVRNVGSGQNA